MVEVISKAHTFETRRPVPNSAALKIASPFCSSLELSDPELGRIEGWDHPPADALHSRAPVQLSATVGRPRDDTDTAELSSTPPVSVGRRKLLRQETAGSKFVGAILQVSVSRQCIEWEDIPVRVIP